jgi:hypothetical protein
MFVVHSTQWPAAISIFCLKRHRVLSSTKLSPPKQDSKYIVSHSSHGPRCKSSKNKTSPHSKLKECVVLLYMNKRVFLNFDLMPFCVPISLLSSKMGIVFPFLSVSGFQGCGIGCAGNDLDRLRCQFVVFFILAAAQRNNNDIPYLGVIFSQG